ncbi:MAG: kelch repeat-containing protein [Bacteroidota bacterium]
MMEKIQIILKALFVCWLLTSCDDENEAVPNDDNMEDTTNVNLPPNDFNLIGVTNNALGVNLLPTFSWDAAEDPDGDAVTYSLLLDTLTQPSTVIEDGLQDLTYELSDRLLLQSTYRWKIRASDDEGNDRDSEVYSFTTRGLNIPDEATDTQLPARQSHATTVFKDRLWLVGGFIAGFGNQNDVWFSEDGVTWEVSLENLEAPFTSRNGHQLVTFDNKLWLIGGSGFGDWPTDIWSSNDGETWQLAQKAAPYGDRIGHMVIVFENRLWLIGGRDQQANRLSDIWVSPNGVDWTQVTASAPFGKRSYFTSLVFDDKLWLMGGNSDEGTLNDVWFSAEGETWSRATEHADFSARSAFDSFVLDGRMWIVAGGETNEIWSSINGINWIKNTSNPNFTPRIVHTADVFKDKVFVIGGRDPELITVPGVWVLD